MYSQTYVIKIKNTKKWSKYDDFEIVDVDIFVHNDICKSVSEISVTVLKSANLGYYPTLLPFMSHT